MSSNPPLGRPTLSLVPRGLLSFLGIQSGGRNPQNLSETLAPVLDLWDQYVGTQLNTYSATTSVPAGSSAVALSIAGPWVPQELAIAGETTVPSSEWWYVRNATCTWSINNSEEADAQICYDVGGVGTALRIFPPTVLSGLNVGRAVPATVAGARVWTQPQWLPPGAVLKVFAYYVIGATPVPFASLLSFVRLPT